MKRALWGIFATLLLLVGFAPATHASTDDFRFSQFQADYYLGSDSEGRSTLRTVEKFVAEFPDYDQNHGIERAIPKNYDGHTTHLTIVSVTDGSGRAVPYSTYDSNDNEVLRIGKGDTYVHGAQTYVLTYTQRDVTLSSSADKRAEFYWDTNGTLWPQSFGSVTARVHIADSLLPTLTKDTACYFGAEGSTKRCDIATNGSVITATVGNLRSYENMTVAIGFTLGTFRGYQPSLWDKIVAVWQILTLATSIVALIMLFWLVVRYGKLSNRTKELNPVAPEYIPPANASVLVAAQVGEGTRADATAQLIDLAVRRYITISQTAEKTIFKQAEYDLEIVKSVTDLREEEQEFVRAMFGGTEVGTILKTKTLKQNYGLYSKLQSNASQLTKRIKSTLGLRAKDTTASRVLRKPGLIMIIAGIVTISPLLLVVGLITYGCAWMLTPLTDDGLTLRRYLAGLKLYIESAEKDRLKALQSPEGAEKTGVTIKGETDKKLVRLYERVLPYAVLFGQEKEWNKQLAVRYEESGVTPGWYVGQNAFNAAVFSSAMSDFTSSMNSYGSSTSSSTGGSTGGGSSGGGGGGGGGGGW